MQKSFVKVSEKKEDKIYNNFSRINCRCQLVVKLKANKYY